MPLLKRSGYWRDVSPRSALGDLVAVWRQADTNRWRIAVAAAIVTTAIFSVMWQEGAEGPPPKPEITYVTTFAPGRSDAAILASNRASQHVQDKLAALQARRDADMKAMYKTIGRASGMDVDAMERKADADDAAAARAAGRGRAGAAAEQARAVARVDAEPGGRAR